jgi:7,8-dihydropterin-6-yl-methyl-4-(beta-D-ribofuranosyl)aminobenzene 5'-phosphate synthase
MCDTGPPASPITFVPADVDWSGQRIPLEPVDEVQVLTVCDNTVDIFLIDQGPARRLLSVDGPPPSMLATPTMVEREVVDGPLAQHGFSALVTVRRGDRARTVLFDTGITPDGCVENLRRMGKDPAGIEAIVCSQGHFDHTAGLSGLAGRLGRRNLPVVVHPEFWTRRRLAIPGREPLETPTTSRRALEEVGFSVVEQQQPSFVLDGALLVTGEVDRTTDFEQGFLIHQAYRGRTWVPDPLILDDQALIANVAGKGLVILTGCGHAGIVNICRYAQRLTSETRVHAVVGGFHLNGPLFEPIIPATLDALEQLQPDIVVPAHCTGWRAVHAIAARFPQQFIQNSVGTTFHLAAEAAPATS